MEPSAPFSIFFLFGKAYDLGGLNCGGIKTLFSECLSSSFEGDIFSFSFSIGAVATSVGCVTSS